MTKDSARKRAARQYKVEHPGISYRDALSAVSATPATRNPYAGAAVAFLSIEELLAQSLDTKQLLDIQLTIADGTGGFEVEIADVEGPVDIDDVSFVDGSAVVDEHEELDDGGTIGEVFVDAEIAWSGCVYKSDYYAAADDAPWILDTADWNDHYVRVTGRLLARVSYLYVADEGSQSVDNVELESFEQLELLAPA